MSEFAVGVIVTVGLLAMVFMGVRVYAAAAMAGLVGMVALIGWEAGAGIVGTIPHSKSINYVLSVLPMFILIGFIAYHAGLTHALFRAARAWFGWVPGGLAVASVFATAGFAAVSGASTATAAVFSRVAIPHMLDHGYDRRLAAGGAGAPRPAAHAPARVGQGDQRLVGRRDDGDANHGGLQCIEVRARGRHREPGARVRGRRSRVARDLR